MTRKKKNFFLGLSSGTASIFILYLIFFEVPKFVTWDYVRADRIMEEHYTGFRVPTAFSDAGKIRQSIIKECLEFVSLDFDVARRYPMPVPMADINVESEAFRRLNSDDRKAAWFRCVSEADSRFQYPVMDKHTAPVRWFISLFPGPIE